MSHLYKKYQRFQSIDKLWQQSWLPLLLGLVVTIAVLGLWQQLLVQEQLHVEQLVQQKVDAVEAELNRELSNRILILQRMAKRWQVSGGLTQSLWEADAASYIQDSYAYQAIEWVDPSQRVRWVVPLQGNETAQNFDLTQDFRRQVTLRVARDLRQPLLTRTLSLVQGKKGFLACVPLFIKTGDGAEDRFDGFIVGIFQFQTLFDSLLKTSPEYQIQIFDRGELIYSQEGVPASTQPQTAIIQAYNADWQVKIFPTSELLAQERSLLPNVILLGGLGGAWLLARMVDLAQRSEYQARRAKKINGQLQEEILHRQQVEASLRESEERWHLVLRGNNDGIWDWNVQTNEVFFSSRWKEMLGFADCEISNCLEEWLKRVHPDDLARVTAVIQDHFAKKTPFYISEHRVQCKDSSFKWILDRGQALWDEAGNAIRMTGSHTDITERKQAEAMLRQSEEKYRQLIDHLNVGFVIHASDSRIVQCNAMACNLLGVSMAQMLGKVAIDPHWHFMRDDGTLMPPEEYPVNRVLRTKDELENYVVGISRGSQPPVWVLATAFPELDAQGQLKQVVVTFIDISQLKQAEIAIAQLGAIVESSEDAIIGETLEGMITSWNAGAEKIFGYKTQEIIGRSSVTLIPEADWQEEKRILAKIGNGEHIANYDTQRLRKDGTLIDVSISVSPIRDASGKLIGASKIARDIRERKAAEAALQQSESTLRSFFNSETMLMGIVELHDNDILHLSDNQTSAHFFGTTPEAMQNRFASEMGVPQAHLQQWLDTYREAARTQAPARFEYPHAAPTGQRWLAASVCQISGSSSNLPRFSYIVEDITERKRAEAELREMAEVMENAISGISRLDPQGRYLYVNKTYATITGYQPEEMVGMPWQQTVFPEELEKIVAAYYQMLQIGRVEIEATGVRKDGSLFYKQLVMIASYDEQHQFLGHYCFMKDISERARLEAERKRAETALEKELVRSKALFDTSMDGVVVMDRHGNVVQTSPSFARMIGYTIEETLNLNVADWEAQWTREELQLLRENVVPLFETRHRRQDGSVYDVEIGWNRIEIGNERLDFCICRDISTRKQAEEELRHQKEMFQAIVDHIPVMIVLFNDRGQIELINPELEQQLGWSLAEWHQQDIFAQCYPDPVDRQNALDHMLAATGNWRDFTSLDANGQPLETSWANVQLSGGRFLGIGQDISDRKRKEIALRQAMEAAEAANLAKSMFLANMSHELRTPLNVILGFAQVMMHSTSLTQSQREDLQTIRRSGDHLLSLINDILDLSKIEAGHCTVETTGFDLIALLHSLRSMFSERAISKGIQIYFNIDPEVPQFILTDAPKLRQILLNLLSNAIKFTKEGNVTLQVKVRDGEGTSSPSNFWQNQPSPQHPVTLEFTVSDTGVGIAPEEIDTIFDAFVQAGAGRKSTSGTGLGLTISHKLLEIMGGEIAVTSTLGKGSTFRFTLPAYPTSGVDIPPEQNHRLIIGLAPGQSQRRILVVDDQLENRLLMVRLLTQLGLEVREASNGQEGVQIWQDWQPDLIWMDIRMPVLDGYEATKQIRAIEQDRASIIIALTAQASQSDRSLALTAGCNDYISKPFREETLFLKMAEYLDLKYIYAESSDLTEPQTSQDRPSAMLLSLPDLIRLPEAWVKDLEEAAVCGDDRAVVNLVEQLSPELMPLAVHLTELANHYEFEQILQLINSHYLTSI